MMRIWVRAILPAVDVQRLRFRGGWSGLPIFAIMTLVYPLSLQQADWVELSSHFVLISVAGSIVGTVVGNGRMRPPRVAALGAGLGALAVVLFTVGASGDAPFRVSAVRLGVDVNTWVTQVLAGEAARGQSVFILFLGASVWAAAFVGSFALARTGRPWESILLTGVCLTINVSLALSPLLLDLIVFTLCALVLMVRLHIVALQERWERHNIQPSGEMDWRVLRGGLTWTTVLVIMALVTPRVGAADVLDTAFNAFENPYQHVETEWQRFFAGVSGPSRLRGVSFSDAIRLGQSPNLGESVVMTVDSTQGHFWRAITYDFYTGQGWRGTEADRVDKVSADQFAKREKLDVTFDVQEPFGNRLFGANEPVKASVPAQFVTGEDRSFSDGIRAFDQHQASTRYTVTSYVSTADKGALRRAPTALPDAVKRTYLQIPSTLPQRVRDLALQIVVGKDDAYDRAEAIESYLRTTYHYAPVVRPPPPGRDPVDYFLFDLKEDFCEYFATSMVMMLREVGVPARMVEGFTAGTFDPDAGHYVVKQVNAHAWVEAYFPGYGWIEFEPTPSETPFLRAEDPSVGGSDTASSSSDDEAALSASDRLAREERLGEGGDVSGTGDVAGALPIDPTPIVGALGAILLATLAFVARFEWRFRGLSPVEASWGKAELLASYLGHRARPSQTTYEYASSLAAAVPDVRGPIQAIADARVRERYSPAGTTDDDRERVEDAWWRIARSLLALVPQRVLAFVASLLPRR